MTKSVMAFAAAALLAAASAMAATPQPMTPYHIIERIAFWESEFFSSDTSSFNLRQVELSAHHLRRSGTCNPQNILHPDTLLQDLSLKGLYQVFCYTRNGKHSSVFAPRNHLLYPAERAMDFTQPLNELGIGAAESVGIADSAHGAPDHISISIAPRRRTTEADVFYKRGPVAGTVSKLRFRVVNRVETVRRVFY